MRIGHNFFSFTQSRFTHAAFLILFLFNTSVNATGSAKMACQDIDLMASPLNSKVRLPILKEYVRVDTEIKSRDLVFLTTAEYRIAVANDEIPVNAILILNEIPLIEDLPFVSAVIVNKELLLEATHIQLLAEKIGIPIILSPGVFTNFELRRLAQSHRSFKMFCKNSECNIMGSEDFFIAEPKLKSILPKSFDRSVKKLYNIDYDRMLGRKPRELSGDKYFELMGFKFAFPHLVPDISCLSSGYFEDFLNTYMTNGRSLRFKSYELNRNLEKASAANDEKTVKELLESFRNDILTSSAAQPHLDVFDAIKFELESYYTPILKSNQNKVFSIRSNQDVEDLIAAGLYKSTVAQSLSKIELERSIRKNWSSLYDYRAYTIRRYWGQRESNLSTPLMIHPFIDNNLSHSVGSFKINAQSKLELDINMVIGDDEKATNPSHKAEVIQLALIEDDMGVSVQFRSSDSPALRANLKSLVGFFNEVKSFVKNEFLLRDYVPAHIGIEFVVQQNPTMLDAEPKVVVLQYKPSLNQEVVIDLLHGLISREDTDKKSSNKNNILNTEMLLESLSVKNLQQILPGLYKQSSAGTKAKVYRYALLFENQKAFFIFWDTSEYHVNMKLKFLNSKAKWLKSGYIKLTETKNNANFNLIFTETTDDDTDVPLLLPFSQKIFQQALDEALHSSPHLQQLLETHNTEISFHTYEGQGILHGLEHHF